MLQNHRTTIDAKLAQIQIGNPDAETRNALQRVNGIRTETTTYPNTVVTRALNTFTVSTLESLHAGALNNKNGGNKIEQLTKKIAADALTTLSNRSSVIEKARQVVLNSGEEMFDSQLLMEDGSRNFDSYMTLLLKTIGDKKKEEGKNEERDEQQAVQAKAAAAVAKAGGAGPLPDVNMEG